MGPRKSKVWRFFDFFPDNKKKVKCHLCSTVLTYCVNTSNMKNHLLARHSSENAKVNKNKGAANDSGTSKGQGDEVMEVDVDAPTPTSLDTDANAPNSTKLTEATPTPGTSSGGGPKQLLKRAKKTIRDLFPRKKCKKMRNS